MYRKIGVVVTALSCLTIGMVAASGGAASAATGTGDH